MDTYTTRSKEWYDANGVATQRDHKLEVLIPLYFSRHVTIQKSRQGKTSQHHNTISQHNITNATNRFKSQVWRAFARTRLSKARRIRERIIR